MTDHRNHIGIIGGGIAGLTLGCALLKEGIPAIIFEKMPEETSHGAAISLYSNAFRLLDRQDNYNYLKKFRFRIKNKLLLINYIYDSFFY